MKQLMTSLQEIRSYYPCATGWATILKAKNNLCPTTEFPLIDCCDSNDFRDVCWLLGKRKTEISIVMAAANACAESVKQYAESQNVRDSAYAIYAANAAYAAADAAADAAIYVAKAAAHAAADAAAYAANAAYAADAAIYVDATVAYNKQVELNMQFLRQAILDYEQSSNE